MKTEYLISIVIGLFLCFLVIGGVASFEDGILAHQCDYAGKVELNKVVYTCAVEKLK